MIQFDTTFVTLISFFLSSTMRGVFFIFILLILIAALFQYFPRSRVAMIGEFLYEKVFRFYESIIGKQSSLGLKTYIVSLFFIILLCNLGGVVLDFIAPIFGVNPAGEFIFASYITIPSSDLQFNIALALVSILLLIILQARSHGIGAFLREYFPIMGKGYLVLEKGNISPKIYFFLSPIVRVFDSVISLFLGFLDIIGLCAKVVSLSFRLFGNIVSGGILLAMLIVGMSNFTSSITGFLGGINFPVALPLIVYAQGLLVAVIQAMVFSLLVAIFIRVSRGEETV